MRVVFDVGGTHIRVSSSQDGKTLGEIKDFDTPKEYSEGAKALGDAIEEISKGNSLESIAGGLPGPLAPGGTHLLAGFHIQGWVGGPLKSDLEKKFSVPVYIENDAALAALGEAVFGAGKGYKITGYLGVGTGIGGAKIEDQKIDAHSVGFEPGHQIIDPDKSMVPNAAGPRLEDYASGTALKDRFNATGREIEDGTAGIPKEEVWKELGKYLAVGIHNAVMFWSPDVMVIGGSMTRRSPSILNHAIEELKNLPALVPYPPVKPADLGDHGGLYGALALTKEV